MNKKVKITIKAVIGALIALILVAAIYIGYVFLSYSRIGDNITLEVQNDPPVLEKLDTKTTYVATTQNIGFGAYSKDYSFFMDGGKYSRARSEAEVERNIDNLSQQVFNTNADFFLLQEVDTDSTRSYHIDQAQKLRNLFAPIASSFAVNYHSAYLFYPILKPHGASNSGLLTMGVYKMSSAIRRSVPVSSSLSKFLDLDRCFSKSYFEIEGGKQFVLYNVHMSAYGAGEDIRSEQMKILFEDMQAEYNKGNYCVAGGDFNCDFTGDSIKKLNEGKEYDYEWAKPFPDELLPSCIKKCDSYEKLAPTCRNADIPYEEGNFTIIVDGFLVSENVEVKSVKNIDNGFEYSDHNPVALAFKFK